jgi:tetratricopeptide (TPR) repeat protein
MLNNILYSSLLILLFSCNNSSNQKNLKSVSLEDTLSTPEGKLALIANEFYESKHYALAILYYDSLISMDSLKGSYYFKRAYCKTKLSSDDPTAVTDYIKSIEMNYSKKESAYLNIGVAHQFKAVFRCSTDQERIAQLDSALYFYNQCLKIDPSNNKAIQWKDEVNNDLTLIK